VYRAVDELAEPSIPESLRSLIGARLDALEPADRTLLQDASVLGRTFSPSALASIAGISESELEPRLRLLVRRELLQLEADPRSPERGQYGFVQSLIREVAYDTLARRDRRARHLAAARYFETLGDDELAGVLASHYVAAHTASAEGPEADALAAQARLALRGAAERAAALGGHEQSMRYLEQALALTDQPVERGDLQERAANSADIAARYQEGLDLARSAVDAYREAADDEGVGRALALLGVILIDSGDLPEAVRTLEAALADMPHGSDPVRALILTNLSRALYRSGEYQRSVDVADEALSVAEPLNLDSVIADAFLNKGGGLLYLGRRREALSIDESALQIAAAGGFTDIELRARNNIPVALFRDDARRALEIIRGGSDLARRVGNRTTGAWLAATTAFFAYVAGDGWDEALEGVFEALSWPTSVSEHCRLLATEALIKVARGDEPKSAIDALNAAGTGVTEPNARAYWETARSQYALLEGDLSEAYAAAFRAADEPVSVLPAFVLPLAIRAALWQRDTRSVEAAVQRLEADSFGDGFIQAERTWASAVMAALHGDRAAALQGFGEARRRMGVIGADFQSALFALDAIDLLGTDEAELRDGADEAAATFERLRASPYLERLEAALGSGSRSSPAPVASARP
jgi:tetratricopeptide (TPR) repeat protein